MKSKIAGAVLVSGALAFGVAGAASASTPTGSTGTSTGTGLCTRAPHVLARLQRVDNRITTVLPKLQAAEQKATAAGHPKRAQRIERLITRLHKRQGKVTTRTARVEQRCPGATPASSGASTSTTT